MFFANWSALMHLFRCKKKNQLPSKGGCKLSFKTILDLYKFLLFPFSPWLSDSLEKVCSNYSGTLEMPKINALSLLE